MCHKNFVSWYVLKDFFIINIKCFWLILHLKRFYIFCHNSYYKCKIFWLIIHTFEKSYILCVNSKINFLQFIDITHFFAYSLLTNFFSLLKRLFFYSVTCKNLLKFIYITYNPYFLDNISKFLNSKHQNFPKSKIKSKKCNITWAKCKTKRQNLSKFNSNKIRIRPIFMPYFLPRHFLKLHA